jgi:endoglucanase
MTIARLQHFYPLAFFTAIAALPPGMAGCSPAAGGMEPASAGGKNSAPADPNAAGGNLLKNSNFDDGTSLPWMSSFTLPADGQTEVVDGRLCLTVKNAGTNPWDVQIRHREMVIQKGHTYTVRVVAKASAPTKMRPKVGQAGPPYAEYWSSTVDVSTEPQLYVGRFRMDNDDDATAEFAFHVGGALATAAIPFTLCIDNIELSDPQFVPPPRIEARPISDVRINQVGYLPKLQKLATVKHASRQPVEWQLLRADGSVAINGKTTVHGEDAESGEHVHVIDFSSFAQAGQGYRLKVGDSVSDAFDIAPNVYTKLKYDALAYFYHNRSGIPIEAAYVGDKQWARPAGHLSDKQVPCGKDTGCNYSLDVSGGWNDAGDYGKYVVNGGISAWTLLNLYERTKHLGSSSAAFADGKLSIPERKNGVPDLLDEVRWELEFLLKMQVPQGKPLAGMAHHKIHDIEWTALGLAAHDSKMARHLRPPSTAATLNLAATGAQCARIYKAFDAAFAGRCLAAAERAWAAALQNPKRYAKAEDKVGGGPYDDIDVTDEFYWAAAELFISTGKPEYRDHVLKSAHHARFASTAQGAGGGTPTSMTWQSTAGLGTISLAVVPNALGQGEIAAARKRINQAGDHYLKLIERQGYRVPFKAGAGGKYPWGSNSFVLNNMIVLGLAHDFSGDKKYLDGVEAGMGYLLGRNALGKSYVTGYGDNPLENPHHRFWAHQADAKFPKAPPGAVSGGPNSGLEDPYVGAAGLKGCAPQKCFMDHIEAWSVNEITINWNAPLAWTAAFLDEKGQSAR